jgi:lipid-binding SYLF domain-containing protein
MPTEQQKMYWEKTKTTSKKGFDKVYNLVDKLGSPVNRLSNRLGAEAFWPTTLDKESDKAARILRSFCKDGFYAGLDAKTAEKAKEAGEQVEGPQGKQRVLKKIPTEVIKNAKGLAIFTTMRTGLWVSGAGGSGILVARTGVDGTGPWSPPSGIMLHTAGLGFLVGVDIYDCVVVINTLEAMNAFTKVRCTLGGEVSAVAGPVGIGGVLDSEVHKRRAPIWTYLKSRGFYAGIQVDGTVVIERTDANEAFYGEKISVGDILKGKAKRVPPTTHMLMATIAAAQGDDVDENELPAAGEAPGDLDLEKGTFGIPDADDDDPYGVKALEKEGFEIKEAGTGQRPSMEVFEFKPHPGSPVYGTFTNSARRSVDGAGILKRESWRHSTQSFSSIDKGTQTGDGEVTTVRSHSHSPSKHDMDGSPVEKITEHVPDNDDFDNLHIGGSPGTTRRTPSGVETPEEMPEPAQAISPQRISRARLVTIPKRVPPALPPRNPGRNSGPIVVNASSANEDFSAESPVDHKSRDKDGFDEVALDGGHSGSGGYEYEGGRRESVGSHEVEEAKDAWSHAEGSKEEKREKERDDESEFHSMPSTPAEGGSMREKEDFS